MMVLKTVLVAASLLACAALTNAWPCPDPAAIAPCICTETDIHIDMDCSAVQSDTQLYEAFRNDPFETYRRLTIVKNTTEARVPITRLTVDTFANVTFSYIRISHTTLNDITSDAFLNSYARLETVIVTDGYLTTFPFDMLADCPKLTDLRVFRNKITHMADIHSDSLTYLQASYNPNMKFGDAAFEDAPALEYLILNDIGLDHVAEDTFINQKALKYLDLGHNLIHTLYSGAFTFYETLDQLKLESNRIGSVQDNAISGLKAGTFLWIHRNRLDDTPESAWRPVFDSVNADPDLNLFVFDENFLTCQCNILWLVENDDYMNTLAKGAWCYDNGEYVEDVNVAFLQQNCLRDSYVPSLLW
nr:oplophorus-luciferin 2-monooxygenase non-catalytic subunit-like [Procambarus clarkii]